MSKGEDGSETTCERRIGKERIGQIKFISGPQIMMSGILSPTLMTGRSIFVPCFIQQLIWDLYMRPCIYAYLSTCCVYISLIYTCIIYISYNIIQYNIDLSLYACIEIVVVLERHGRRYWVLLEVRYSYIDAPPSIPSTIPPFPLLKDQG